MKNVFNLQNITLTAKHIHTHIPNFDKQGFIALASDDLEHRELKDRSNQICIGLIKYLPDDYLSALTILLASLQPVINNQDLTHVTTDQTGVAGWMIMPYTQFISDVGHQHIEESLNALQVMTQLFTSEFGIRSFIQAQPQTTLETMQTWTSHPCHHVRRLVSEGSRPLLPWAMQLPSIKADPSITLPLLDKLKSDESEYVRRSVANHLNDVAKNQPEFVSELVNEWMIDNDNARFKMLKHASRTLIKQGHKPTLSTFGYHIPKALTLDLTLSDSNIQLGDTLGLTLHIDNQYNANQNLLVDFVIYHQKANGQLTPKVFKWKELQIKSGEMVSLTKQHTIKTITTRKYYSGRHKVVIQINGDELIEKTFYLTC